MGSGICRTDDEKEEEEEARRGGDKTRQDTTLGGRSASQHVTSKKLAPEWPLPATSHGIQPLRARPSARAPTRPKARANALEGGGGTANTHRLIAQLRAQSKLHKKYLDSGLVFAEEEEEKEEEEQRTKDASVYVCANHNTM